VNLSQPVTRPDGSVLQVPVPPQPQQTDNFPPTEDESLSAARYGAPCSQSLYGQQQKLVSARAATYSAVMNQVFLPTDARGLRRSTVELATSLVQAVPVSFLPLSAEPFLRSGIGASANTGPGSLAGHPARNFERECI